MIVPAYGAHMPNRPAPASAFEKFEVAGFDSCKLLATNYQAGNREARLMAQLEVERIRQINPHATLYVRLPDSFTEHGIRDLGHYVDLCVWYIDGYYERGVINYQVGNEDNDPASPWWREADPVKQCRDFYLEAMKRIRSRVPADVRLGSSPIQHAPGRTPYVAWYNGWLQLFAAADFVTANCYYGSSAQIGHPDFGGSWLWYAQRSDKPIYLGEFGPEPSLSRAEQTALTIAYMGWIADQPRIEAGAYFLLDGTLDWEDRNPTMTQCRILRAWRDKLRVLKAA